MNERIMSQTTVIFLIVCITTVLASVIAAYVFGPVGVIEEQPTVPVPYPYNSAVVAAMYADHPRLNEADNFTKTCIIRDWVAEHSLVSSEQFLLNHNTVNQKNMHELYNQMAAHEGGMWCSGYARLLKYTYTEMGFEAYSYATGTPNVNSHAVTLVNVDGKLIVQDAYFQKTYVDAYCRTPLSVFEIIDRENANQSETILPFATLQMDEFMGLPGDARYFERNDPFYRPISDDARCVIFQFNNRMPLITQYVTRDQEFTIPEYLERISPEYQIYCWDYRNNPVELDTLRGRYK